MFTDSAANENKHQKFTRIRNSQSECEMHEFDEMTPLSPTAGNMTGKNRDTLSNSSEELSTRARRDPTTRFMIRENRREHGGKNKKKERSLI